MPREAGSCTRFPNDRNMCVCVRVCVHVWFLPLDDSSPLANRPEEAMVVAGRKEIWVHSNLALVWSVTGYVAGTSGKAYVDGAWCQMRLDTSF